MVMVERWCPLPDFQTEFIAALPAFGADAALTCWATNYAQCHGGRCYWDAQFVGKLNPQRCLNIGGAPFIFEYALRKTSPEVTAFSVDLQPERFPGVEAALGTQVVKADIERELPSIGQFDVVVFTEVFEHLRLDLLGTLARVHALLNSGGRLYLTMPNGLGFNALRRHLLRGRTGPSPVEEWSKLSELGHMGHVREYSLIEVSEVLAHTGFKIETACYRTQDIKWPMRDLLLKMRPAFGDEVLIVASKI